MKKKLKVRRGYYFLETKKGYFVFDTGLKRGRAFLKNKPPYNLTIKKHPKLIKTILTKGSWCPTSKEV